MINDRIAQLISSLELNPTSFSEEVDVNVTVIFNIIKGRRSKPSFELILNILSAFPIVNAEWLIKGEGYMFTEGDDQNTFFKVDFFVDPGNSSADDLYELLQSLSDLNRANGGEGLQYNSRSETIKTLSL